MTADQGDERWRRRRRHDGGGGVVVEKRSNERPPHRLHLGGARILGVLASEKDLERARLLYASAGGVGFGGFGAATLGDTRRRRRRHIAIGLDDATERAFAQRVRYVPFVTLIIAREI